MLHERYRIMWDDERAEYALLRFDRNDDWRVIDRQPTIMFLLMALQIEAYLIEGEPGPDDLERLQRN